MSRADEFLLDQLPDLLTQIRVLQHGLVRFKNGRELRIGIGLDSPGRDAQILRHAFDGAFDALQLELNLMLFDIAEAGQHLHFLPINERMADDQSLRNGTSSHAHVFFSAVHSSM